MFHVVPSNKQELLTQVLIAFIQDDYAANKRHVFDASSIVVESQGMKHYLNMEIAKQTGLSMNIDYPLVSREIYRICRLVLGDDVPHDSPYKREYLVWNIYGILQSDAFSEQPQSTLANAYWQSQNDPNLQCFRLAKQVADIFEQYSIYRSDWLAQWEQGNTLGLSDALEPWQQLIWQMLTEHNAQHPAYLRAAAIEGLANATELLPNPLYIFAVNTLSPTQITFFSELAKHTDVYLFFLNPCSEYWGDLVSDKAALKRQLANSIDMLQAEEQRHPLLANLGSQGRALFNQLQDIHYPDITDNQLFIAPELDGHNATSILHTIQADIASGMLNPTAINSIEPDRSLQIHSCYSPVREVQVLHDELLRILQHDPSIQPHEILVMCPSVEEYAPFVNSVFRPVHKPQAPGSPQLVCSIADRAPLDSESAVMMFLDMLELPDSRFSVLKIIDYLHIPMVQTKLTLTPDELSMCQLWLEQANIKWGVNAAHKNGILHSHDSHDSDEIYSWEWGLQRLALGCLHSAAAGQPANYDYVIAIEGLNTRVLAKLLVLIELLKQFRNALTGAKSIAQWVVLLQEMLADLFASPNQEEVLKTIHKAVVDLGKQVEFAGYEGMLELAIIRESLTDRFSIPDALNQFLTGQVTFSSMVPMRSVPFKMICILGLNDGVFPRVSAPNSIDLIAFNPPQKGDRSRRNEDRYLFLEAILSARDYLYLSYQGQSVKDNQTLEPSLVLQEFIDYLNRKFTTPDCFADTVIQVQPLQPFSTSLFDTSSELYQDKGSYDQGWLSLALHQSHRHEVSYLDVHKNIYIDEPDLINMLKNPFKLLVNHQYQIFLDEFINLNTDIEPFNLDALTKDKLLSVAVSQAQLIATGEVVDALDDYRQPLINRGDISSWMLENTDMKPYEQAAENIAQALTGVNLTTEIRHIHLHKTVQNVPFYIQASVAMDPEYRTDTLIHKEGPTAKRPEFSLAVLFRHCLKLCYFQQTGDTTLRYLKAKTLAKQATFGIESVTIPSNHISLADAEELIELLLSVYYHALQTPTFVHLALHNDLQAKLPADATCYSEIPNVAFLLDNFGEQRQDKFSGMKWFLNTYCTWLFPHGFKHQDIDLILLSRLYLHPLIQQAVSGVFVVPDKKPKNRSEQMNHMALNSVTHSTAPVFLPLDVQVLPLAHRHLIEASAGTGKTFNITRIAIKVLLVKKISITQLLIVTFTKAATQELRARIAQTLQEFIGMLEGEPCDWDPLLTHIISTDINMSVENALRMLKVAVFEMDEAAIYTINSFCGRMLTQSSFLTHHPFDQAIIDDSESIYIEVIQDWFLQQQSHPPMRSALRDMGVETPTKYFETYKSILLSTLPVEYPTESSIAALAQCSGQLIFDALAPQRAAFAEELKPHVALIQAYFDAKKKDIIVHQVLDWCNDIEFSDIAALLGVMLHGTAIKGYIKTLGVNDPDALIDIFKEFHNVVKKSFSTYNKRFTEMSENIAAIELIADSLVTIKALASTEKRRCGVLDHSDTVSLFSQQIVAGNAQLISSIQAQFPIALIDEFQDTDADQYAIFQHVYPNDDPSLMLLMIGDPKQAIYGFRGGDVFTYLKAVNDANYHWSMDTNYRSTESVVNGYNTLFYGLSVPQYRVQDLQLWAQQQATISHDDAIGILPSPEQGLFDYGIQYNWILATAKAKANNTPLYDPLSQSGTHFFALSADNIDIQHPVAQDKFTAIKLMSQWVAQEVQRLLTSASLGDKLVAPADIAILVNNRSQGQIIKKIFANCGLNSVILSDRTSIFASDQAINLYRFLNGILNFNQDRAFKAMLGTDLMGLERETLYEIENDLNTIDQYKLIAHDLLQRWQRDGVMAMLIFVLKNNFTIYGQSDEVERIISNYMQLAEILNEVERTQSLVTMTVTFLYEKLAQKNAADSYCQRLESDDALIKIVTIHGSKGLEYPIVFVPFDSFGKEKIISDGNKFCTYYDIEAQEKRHFLGRVPHIEAMQTEQLSREAIRLLYVAITRAAHRCYLGYQDIHHHSSSAIHYILSEVGSEQQLSAHAYMDTLAKHEPDVFAYHAVPDSISLDKMKSTSTKPVLAALEYAGKTQSQWQVFSYSKLLKHNVQIDLNEKSHADDTAIFSPNAHQVTDHESASIRFTLTKGAGAGNLLHNVLEKSDFTQPFENELVNQEFKEYLAADIEHAPAVIDWLNEVVRTPLINPFSGSTFTLQQITMRQTLREPQFYFPLTDTSIESLTQLLKFHRGMHVSIASLQRKLQGMMQGFIDLIFEVDGKYYVSDYKSTHLGNSFASYSHDALLHDIQSHHYDLQYLIYIWVLHNLLSQRIADYDPQIHLGGVYYLYLRGMSPQAPTHSGVYYREITQQDISALHNTFASSANTEGKQP